MNDKESLAAKAKATPTRKKGWMLWIVALLLLAGLAAFYRYIPLPEELTGLAATAPLPETSENLSERISALEKTLTVPSQGTPVSGSTLNAIESDIASLDARLAAIEQGETQRAGGKETVASEPEIEKLRNELQNLALRLTNLEHDPKKSASIGAPLDPRLRAIEDLRESLWKDSPFNEQLAALLSVTGDDPAMMEILIPITVYANQGIPTLPMIREQFDSMAAAVLEAKWIKPKASWWQRILARLASVVTLRRTGDLEGNDLEAVLARAEIALNSGDLERTVSLLEGIEQPALQAAEFWFRDARARLVAEMTIRRLRQVAFSKVKTPTESQQ